MSTASLFEKFRLSDRFHSILAFAIEVESLKNVIRQSPLYDVSRRENSAEHSWEVALLAILFSEFCDFDVDIARVVKMLLIHDIVEIDAGDTFVYDDKGRQTQDEREQAAAKRIFGLLPDDLGAEFHALWTEFETKTSPDARYASAIDRWQPLLHNYVTGGGTWRTPQASAQKVFRTKSVIGGASSLMWDVGRMLISDGLVNDFFRPRTDGSKNLLTRFEGKFLAVVAMRREDCPFLEWRQITGRYEQKHGITLESLTFFPESAFVGARRLDRGVEGLYVASTTDDEVVQSIRILGEVANGDAPSLERRKEYLDAILRIYSALESRVPAFQDFTPSVCIAPRREGFLIASRLFPEARGTILGPHAKRMALKDGMLIGLTDMLIPASVSGVTIIDGAIATGTTIMAIINNLPPRISKVTIVAAHATNAGVQRLLAYAHWTGLTIHIYVGHVSGVLNDRGYAVEPDHRDKVVVGDLGDLTSAEM